MFDIAFAHADRNRELMRFTSAGRELATTSIEESLTACLSEPIRDEVEVAIHRVAEVVCSEMCRHYDMAQAFSALKKIFPPGRWSSAKSVIGGAMGRDARTIQRLTFRPDKKKNTREALSRAEDHRPDQSLSDDSESNVSSITAECLTKVVERAGRKFTPTPKVINPRDQIDG